MNIIISLIIVYCIMILLFSIVIEEKFFHLLFFPVYILFLSTYPLFNFQKKLENKENKLLENEKEQYDIVNMPGIRRKVWEQNHGDGYYREEYKQYTLGRYLIYFSRIGSEEEILKWNNFINKYKELLDEYKNKYVMKIKTDKILGTQYIEVGDIILSSDREINWKEDYE